MGVSGCGKSTVGGALARRLNGDFFDADPFHPPANVEKMSRGIPLTDEDRAGWLEALADLLRNRQDSQRPTVLACSALKEAYRRVLRVSPLVRFVYLKGRFEVIEARMKARTGHFMKPGMLESQFQTLEEPATGPGMATLAVDLTLPIENLVDRILAPESWEG
jgi:carbohydrate kinase (thermoresistant glucokinase family)